MQGKTDAWQPTIRRSGAPLYVEIANAIISDIERRRLEPGVKLPSQRDLARVLRVTMGTVAHA